MNFYKIISLGLFILSTVSIYGQINSPCIFPNPIIGEDNSDPCGICSGCSSQSTLPPLSDLVDDANGTTTIFTGANGGGITSESLQGQIEFQGTNPAYPMSATEAFALGNYIDQNFNIANMIECANLNCIDGLDGGSNGIVIPELLLNTTDWMNNLATMGENMINSAMFDADNDPEDLPGGFESWYEYLQSFDQDDLDLISSEANTDVGIIDLDMMAEIFFGVYDPNDEETGCPGGSNLDGSEANRNNNPSEGSAVMDLFSGKIPGLDKMGNDQLLPGPSSMNLLNQIQTGVDLYNGLPSIGANLYTLQANDLSVPVSLSYNSAGVRVDDIGSETGTNWNLDAGGKISRVVMGLPDEYTGTTIGGGIGPVAILKPCVDITGAGLSLVAPHKEVVWNPEKPQEIKFYVTIFSSVLTIPIVPVPVYIPYYISLEVNVSLNIRYKEDHITFKEKGVGYNLLTDETAMATLNLEPLNDLEGFHDLPEEEQVKYLRKKMGNRSIEDAKFISPMIQQVLDYWEGITHLFADEVKNMEKLDTEPDEFFFNFGNYSGKFVFGLDGNIYTIPHMDLKIENDEIVINNQSNIVHFKVTTPEGMVYHFGNLNENGVEYSQQISYTLPNSFTYPELNSDLFTATYGQAAIDETSLPFDGLLLCYPRSLMYGTTYERNYIRMPSPKYASTWYLTKIESILTKEIIDLNYAQQSLPSSYYSQKSLQHDFPNFAVDGDNLSSPFNPLLFNPGEVILNTEWHNGKASLTYSVTENKLWSVNLENITGYRGDILTFHYDEDRVDFVGEKLLTEIKLMTGGVFSKGWKLVYEHSNPIIQFECEDIPLTQPVYAAPDEEFSIDLGELQEKVLLPVIRCKNTYTGVCAIQETYVQNGFLVPFIIDEVSKDHYGILSEFGSLVEIKDYENVLDIELEKSIFRAEKSRSFLKSILEIDRDAGENNYLDISYNGDVKTIPKRFSMNQDLWGFYNDNNTSLSLLPAIKYKDVDGQTVDISGNQNALKKHFSFNYTGATGSNGMFLGHNENANYDKAVIGSLSSLKIATGGTISYSYSLNDWPTGEGEITIPGAGLRILQKTEDALNGPIKVTNYEFTTPTIINRPIRLSMHQYDKNDYFNADVASLTDTYELDDLPNLPGISNVTLLENYVRTSTHAMNPWMKNKNNYVGYGKVTEIFVGGGSIEHTFTTPEERVYPTIYHLNATIGGLELTDVDPVSSYGIYGEPYAMPELKEWRYGLETNTVVKDENGKIVSETVNTYEFGLSDLQVEEVPVFGLKAHLFQRNYPGSWIQNSGVGELFNIASCSMNADIVPDIVTSILTSVQFYNPFRRIHKDYFYSSYPYFIEDPRLASSTETTYYPYKEDLNSTTSVATSNYSYIATPDGNPQVHRLSETVTTFNNGQSQKAIYKYANELSPTDSKTDQTVLDELRNIGYAGYGDALRSEQYEGAVLTAGNISAVQKFGDIFVPASEWTVRNGSFVLSGKFTQWNSAGLPLIYKIARHGTGQAVTDYAFLPHEIELTWSENLQLTERKIGSFKEIYIYNGFKEIKKYRDINAVISEYTYDNRGRLKTATSLNARQTKTYDYGFVPNFVNAITTFSDNTPSQSVTSHFNGLGMHVSTIRDDDNAELEKIAYDNLFRVVTQTDLTSGMTHYSYEPSSPLNRLYSSTDAVGNTTKFTYSGSGDYGSYTAVTTEDPNGHETKQYSDAFSRIKAQKSGMGGYTLYDYDNLGRLTTIQNPINETFSYTYNEMDRISQKKVPGAGDYFFWYDKKFRTVASKDANGNILLYKYDDYNRNTGVYQYAPGEITLPTTTSIVGNFDSYYVTGKLAQENIFVTNRTWLASTKSKILREESGLVYQEQTNTFDDIGRVTSSTESSPLGTVSMTNVFNDAGLLTDMSQLTTAGSEEVNMAYEFIFDFLLRPQSTLLNMDPLNQSSISTVLSSLEYNSKDLVQTKYLGGVSTGGFLQKVDYLYDAAGKLTHINTPGELECNQGLEICQIKGEFTVDIKDPGFNCSSTLTTIQIENHTYTVDPVLTLTNPNITPSLQSEIEAALDQYGYLGEVTISSEYESESLITFTILINNTNAPDIVLKDNNCTICEFEAGDCCEIAIPLDGEGAGNPNFALNPDLFYEKLTFDHLNISRIEYGSDCTQGYMRHDFLYDASHRVTDLISTVFEDNTPVLHRYDEHFSYDLAGNIDLLTRKGLISTDANGVGTYGLIDDLAYTYFPGTPNSRLQNVVDAVTDATAQPKGFKPVSSTYGYDNNGNIVSDDGKDLTIAYNVLNLPQLVTGTTGTIKFDHTFSGEQIKKTVDIGGTTETRLYIGGVEFVEGVAETYYHPDGRIFFKEGVPKFQYKIVDHLGNTAVLFEDIDGAGLITMEDPLTGISPEVHQRQFYYSFGMAMEGGWKPQADPDHQYLYNGKELHEDLGLDWYAYGARMYDAAIGRFTSVDPIAAMNPQFSTYAYAANDPISFVDNNGENPLKFMRLAIKLVTKGYKVYKKTGKFDFNDAKKIGVDEIFDFIGDVSTVFDPNISTFHRAKAIVDIALGTDFNNGNSKAKSLIAKARGALDELSDFGISLDEVIIKPEGYGTLGELYKKKGSYTIVLSDGKTYDGKGSLKRMLASAKHMKEKYGVDAVDFDWSPAENDDEALIQEHKRMESHGGNDYKGTSEQRTNSQTYNNRKTKGTKLMKKIIDKTRA